MSKVLYIKANPKSDNDSFTFKISETFVEEYKKSNPEDEIIILDLYKEDVKPLSSKDLGDIFSTDDNPMKKYANGFAEADKYIIAAPFWNLSFPGILKDYIDRIVVAGITFKYTEEGPIGLLKNKKAVHIVARGGKYTVPPYNAYEMGDKYLRTILGFLGVNKVETIPLEMTSVLKGQDLDNAVNNTMMKAKEVAKRF